MGSGGRGRGGARPKHLRPSLTNGSSGAPLPQLVQLSMAASRLVEWLPWFVNTRESEARLSVQEAAADTNGDADGSEGEGGLSPELKSCVSRY